MRYLILLSFLFISCFNKVENNEENSLNCSDLMTNIESTRLEFQENPSSITCSAYRNALFTFLESNCDDLDTQIQNEFDLLGDDCNLEGT